MLGQEITAFGTLGVPPKPRKLPSWRQLPPVLPSAQVDRDERPAYLGFAGKHLNLKPIDVRLLIVLLEHDWHKGIIPKHATLAAEMRCSIATIRRSIERTRYFGFLHVISGKARHTSNEYSVRWPAGHQRKSKPSSFASQLAYHPDVLRYAGELLTAVGLSSEDRDAPRIVDSWLRKGWDPRVISLTVNGVLRHRREAEGAHWMPNSLKYFEAAISKNHGGRPARSASKA
jgi:hypothetical protein